MTPGKNQVYGKDFKSLSVMMSAEEHKAAKIKAAEYGVSIGSVVRLALADERLWKQAAKLKGQE